MLPSLTPGFLLQSYSSIPPDQFPRLSLLSLFLLINSDILLRLCQRCESPLLAAASQSFSKLSREAQ